MAAGRSKYFPFLRHNHEPVEYHPSRIFVDSTTLELFTHYSIKLPIQIKCDLHAGTHTCSGR